MPATDWSKYPIPGIPAAARARVQEIDDAVSGGGGGGGGGGSSYTDEQAQDAVAAAFAAGTHQGFVLTYNDGANSYSVVVNASGITTGTLPDSVIPSAITRDSELSAAVATLVNSAPGTLDTLGELASALQADEAAAATLATLVGQKAQKLAPTSPFTTGSHTPVSGEYVRYNPSSNIAPTLPAAAADQRFGVSNVGSANVTLTCTGSDTLAEGGTTLVLAPGERVVLIGATGTFHTESLVRVISGKADTSYVDAGLAGKADKLTQRSSTATADTTATANEIVPLDTTGGTFTLTGPTGGGVFGARWKTGTVAPTIAAPSGYTIAGAASITMGLAPYTSSGELVIWQAVGTDYQPVGGFKPQTALDARIRTLANGPPRYVSVSTAAISGELLIVNSTSASRTIDPPASPTDGTWVTVINSGTNTVTWNGPTFDETTAVLASKWSGATFVWSTALSVWLVSAVNVAYSGGLTQADADARYPLATQTVMLEELAQTVHFGPATTITAATTFGAWVAPVACKVTAACLIAYGGSIAASNTNYWGVTLRKLTSAGATATAIVSKNTRADNGEAVTNRADWNFDARTFDSAAQTFAKGDVLDVQWSITGTPATWYSPILVFRYEPL